MTVLEAMAAGKPVIVTDSNGLAGAVRDYGAGIVVPGDSAQALVEAMQRLASEPTLAERMGQHALAAVREKFSIDAVADILEGRYRAATNNNGHSSRRTRRIPRLSTQSSPTGRYPT
jgi:glycosyltransferase involved in cell wall biosynthesis